MPSTSRPRIAIAGSIAQRAGIGGHTWVFLQYLLGFQRLGFEVHFLDCISSDLCQDEWGRRVEPMESWNIRYFRQVFERFGLQDCYSLDIGNGQQTLGTPRSEVLKKLRSTDLFINVMGYLTDPELLAAARTKVFLDIDPGFGQMWRDQGWADIFAGHDRFVTIGLNVGQPGCIVPTCGLDWVTTVQPIVLEQWPVAERSESLPRRFTSVISWRGPFGPVDYHGKTYGLRCHEFRKYVGLPARTNIEFELAMDLHPNEAADIALLDANGWKRVSPADVASSPDDYQQYIQQSSAELMIAKNLYVDTAGGWVSDRSICYLASGRPTLVHDTGLVGHLPIDEGLVAFRTPAEAAAGAQEIMEHYPRHCRRAREIAEAYFDSDKVLSRLVESVV